VQVAKSFSQKVHTPPILPPMPIAIDNGLPHITFQLGTTASQEMLQGLMDTCGALNTGFLPFHQWIMSENPSLIAEYIEFNDKNPFEPIKLGGAIRDPDGFDSDTHGNLTAVIRYFTPYYGIDNQRVTLSFALGHDVTVNTIYGLPMLTDIGSMISLSTDTLHSAHLNQDFPILRCATSHGLPVGCTFDPALAKRNSLCNLSATAKHVHFNDDTHGALTTAIDNHDHGYLQRTVHPTK
jgi:hypothetical protein